MTRSVHSGAPHDHNVSVTDGAYGDAIAGAQHKQTFRTMTIAADLDLACDHIDGAFLMFGFDRQRRAGLQPRFYEQRVPRGHNG